MNWRSGQADYGGSLDEFATNLRFSLASFIPGMRKTRHDMLPLSHRRALQMFPATAREARGSLLTRGVALVVLLHFVAVLLMAAMPEWHLAAHADADDGHHQCAVTLMASGGLDVVPGVVLPEARLAFAEAPMVAMRDERPRSAHLERSVLEHGPPVAPMA